MKSPAGRQTEGSRKKGCNQLILINFGHDHFTRLEEATSLKDGSHAGRTQEKRNFTRLEEATSLKDQRILVQIRVVEADFTRLEEATSLKVACP